MQELLINKYEPHYLSEFNYEEDYINYIKKIINNTDINVLLLGHTGSGKTLLIDAILYNYYNVTSLSNIKNNILYISSLKEQGVMFYKNDVKTFCQSTSEIYNKKKTIIIDNLDNLSDINQNIFKMHMEIYGKKVNFICSCTNINKISSIILNHLIVIKLNSINKNLLQYIMNKICKNENLDVDKNLKDIIIKYSNNSVKILINNLEKYRLISDKINFNVDNINNNILLKDLVEFYQYCLKSDRVTSYKKLVSIYKDGYSIIDIIEYMYLNLKYNDDIDDDYKYKIIKILSKYLLSVNNTNEDELIIYFIKNEIIDIINNN